MSAAHDGDQVSLGLLILRVAVGAMMIAHGYNHIFRGGKIKGTGRLVREPRHEAGHLPRVAREHHRARRRARRSCLGLLTPLAAGAIVGVMLVALITNHLKTGFFIFRPERGLGVRDEPRRCVRRDRVRRRRAVVARQRVRHSRSHGWWGLVAAVVIGFGGTVGLLATFWRPPRPEPATT